MAAARPTTVVEAASPRKPALHVTPEAVVRSRRSGRKAVPVNPFKPAWHPASVVPPSMAMDDAFGASFGDDFGWEGGAYTALGMPGEGLHFLGFPYLAELAQRPEYRRISETIATEMTS